MRAGFAVVGPWAQLRRLALARQARWWTRKLALHATRYYAAGASAPALIDEIAEVHASAVELGGMQWPA